MFKEFISPIIDEQTRADDDAFKTIINSFKGDCDTADGLTKATVIE